MDFDKTDLLLKTHPAFRVLRSKNNTLIITFLSNEFKEKNKISIQHNILIGKLSSFLEVYNIDSEENANFDYDDKARNYLDEWTENGFLRKYTNDKGEVVNEITSSMEKIFQWIESLEKKEFIGTESRFKDIFYKLKDITSNAIEDPDKKIKELEQKKHDIDKEIKYIKKHKKFKSFDDYQIKSRFNEVSKISRELLSDFREVEENFKQITRKIYEKQAKKDFTKGSILKYTFDSIDELKESDQGKSFYSFWNFLIDEDKQQELESLIEEAYHLMEERNIDINDFFMKKLKNYLYNSARKVLDSNTLLAEKLTRIISEKSLIDKKVALQTINEIKQLAIKLIEKDFSNKVGIEIEAFPNINLPMERKLGEKPEISQIVLQPEDLNTLEYIDKLNISFYNDKFVNRNQLNQNIFEILKDKELVTLSEITEMFPVTKGLAEVITYISIAGKSEKAVIDADETEIIEFDSENKKYIQTPQIIFRR